MRGPMVLRRLMSGVLILSVISCTTVQMLPDSARYISERRPPHAALVLKNGSAVTLEAPAVFHDSLIGLDPQGQPAIIAVGDVEGVRVREPSAPRTVALMGSLAVGFALLLLAAGGSGPAPDPTEEPEEDHITRP